MKNFNLTVGLMFLFIIGGVLAWVSQYPAHYPKDIISYWPFIVGSLVFTALMIFILILTKRGAYKNQKMPKKEFWLAVGIIVVGIFVIIFLFLHIPPPLHPVSN